jgi:diaminopimelate decarboxylase
MAELVLSERVGVVGEDIMFTSNDTPEEEFVKAKALGAVINLDDITHIPFLEACAGLPDLLCFRYNPGPLKGGNAIIGCPEQAKYGFTRDQLFEGYRLLKRKGVRRFGLHTMVASNGSIAVLHRHRRNPFRFSWAISRRAGDRIRYRQHRRRHRQSRTVPTRIRSIGARGRGRAPRLRDAHSGPGDIRGLKTLHGVRPHVWTGPYGYLVSRVRHIKRTYKRYAGLDACTGEPHAARALRRVPPHLRSRQGGLPVRRCTM